MVHEDLPLRTQFDRNPHRKFWQITINCYSIFIIHKTNSISHSFSEPLWSFTQCLYKKNKQCNAIQQISIMWWSFKRTEICTVAICQFNTEPEVILARVINIWNPRWLASIEFVFNLNSSSWRLGNQIITEIKQSVVQTLHCVNRKPFFLTWQAKLAFKEPINSPRPPRIF